MNKGIRLIAGVALTAAAVLFGAANPASAAEPAKKPFHEIKYANIQWFDPVYVADEKGWFEQEGLKIKWVGEIPAAQLVPSVAARQIDFANRHTPLVLTANAGGAKLKIISAGAKTTKERPHMKYLVLPGSSIKGVKDFKHKKIAINSFGACSEYVLKEYLKRNGLEKDVQFTVIPDANQEQVLKQGQVDVAVLHSPYYEKAVGTGAAREVFSDYVVDNGASGMLPYFTSEELIKENPDVVRKFVKVLVRASNWTNKHHDEAAKIFAKRRGLDPRYVGSWEYYKDGVVPSQREVQWWIDLLVREGKLKKDQIKAADVYTNSYATAAVGKKK
ncbi:ABC transporter substrate-binding protein [Geomesophilobacter sediminis]|uniref:ABC transporter substrate-binding protein n=1 Tax=Geomesophilobacter sediminis TaxID=2798584 RepID=A0A8J7IX41_9BACT|nr:ABC transporter substrate-binding protein [Geomesophilobacter sediminis]MBJ6724337.1 ABC transporter substrate-binding protein [Geomesophilobacter sediminis]